MAISRERQDYIKLKVNVLRKRLQIKKYPIIMEDLIVHKFPNKILLRYMDLVDTADTIAEYDPKNKICVIVINNKKTKKHLQKRLNFSLAHELGHLMLEHYKVINDDLPSDKLQELEEEADEFAGLFLVSEYKLRQHKRVDNSQLSDYFFVSNHVVRIRKERIGIHKINLFT